MKDTLKYKLLDTILGTDRTGFIEVGCRDYQSTKKRMDDTEFSSDEFFTWSNDFRVFEIMVKLKDKKEDDQEVEYLAARAGDKTYCLVEINFLNKKYIDEKDEMTPVKRGAYAAVIDDLEGNKYYFINHEVINFYQEMGKK